MRTAGVVMVDDGLLANIFSAATGVWALVLMVAVALFKTWPLIMARINERLRDKEAEKNSEWSRFQAEIARLVERVVMVEQRCDHLQHEVDECRKREADWMHRAIAAEAYQLGEGEAHQQAQRFLSAERQKPEKPDG
jgi:hypothetical protein